jgi:hypothetical protein
MTKLEASAIKTRWAALWGGRGLCTVTETKSGKEARVALYRQGMGNQSYVTDAFDAASTFIDAEEERRRSNPPTPASPKRSRKKAG